MHFRSQRKSAGDVSLSDYIETGKDGTALSIMDVVSQEEDLFEQVSTGEQRERLRRALRENLTERELMVLTMRYGLKGGPPQPQREVAVRCGISRSYVSRIEKRALEKLREALDNDGGP